MPDIFERKHKGRGPSDVDTSLATEMSALHQHNISVDVNLTANCE